MSCPCCQRPCVEMTVQGMSQFTMRACTNCGHRAWSVDGEPSTIEAVTTAIRNEPRRRRRAA